MDIKDFNPFVRFCAPVRLGTDYARAAQAYDYRLFYVLEGGFVARVGERELTVGPGCLLLIPPGRPYRLLLSECGKSNHIIVNFDFVSDYADKEACTVFDPKEFRAGEIYTRACIPPFGDVFLAEGAHFCADTLRAMCQELRPGREGGATVASGLLKALLARIAREAGQPRPREDDAAAALCERVREYVRGHFAGPIDNQTVARHFGYHPYYLNALFKRKTGGTLHTFILECRLARAEELLLSTDASVAEIGEMCGIRGASYFSEIFLKKRGVTPTAYRQAAR